jgi:hypothetical protein
MPKLFRTSPPLDILEKLIHSFSLSSLQDTTWFSKSSLTLHTFEEILPELEPYYVPCKAKEFIHSPLTHAKAFTILRQLCKVHEIHLTAAERTCAGVKGMWYQLTPNASIGSQSSIIIDFS